MSKSEGLKEEIGWLKVAFGIAIALDASLVAWLAQNYDKVSPVIAFAATCAAVVIAVAVVLINHRAFRRIKELEDL